MADGTCSLEAMARLRSAAASKRGRTAIKIALACREKWQDQPVSEQAKKGAKLVGIDAAGARFDAWTDGKNVDIQVRDREGGQQSARMSLDAFEDVVRKPLPKEVRIALGVQKIASVVRRNP